MTDPTNNHQVQEVSTTPVKKMAYAVAEVAEILGLSRAATYQYVRSGDIPSVTLGGRIIIPCTAIDCILGRAA